MTGVIITSLPTASTLTGAEYVPVVQSGTTVKTPVNSWSYTPAGTGAVTTTVQSKLRETVSVMDFGAVGDGVADDTAAFNAALTASPSMNVIFVPAGHTYRITSTINIVGQKTLCGPDNGTQNFQAAYIYHDPTSSGPLFQVRTPSAGVCIKNLTVTGGNGSFCIESSNEYVRYEYIKMAEYNGSGIRLLSSEAGSSSSKIINCEWIGPNSATDYTGFEIIVNGGDVHLRGCTAIRGAIGINISQGQTIIIDGCSVNKQSRYAGFSSATQFNTAGIKLSGTAYKQAISIRNSYIEACDNGIYVEACESLSIEDNLMYDSGTAGVIGAWTAYGNSSIYLKDSNCKNVTIKNNHITALSNGDSGHTFYAVYFNDASNVFFWNNVLVTTGTYNAQLYNTTGANTVLFNNTQSQSGSMPQSSYDPSSLLQNLTRISNQLWGNFTFQNSWVGAGSAAYTKDALGFVCMRGYITSGTVGAVAFNLPVGYRPQVECSFTVNSNGALGIVSVFTNGNVYIASGNNAYVYLSEIRFKVA